jgi:hypothetical protein
MLILRYTCKSRNDAEVDIARRAVSVTCDAIIAILIASPKPDIFSDLAKIEPKVSDHVTGRQFFNNIIRIYS